MPENISRRREYFVYVKYMPRIAKKVNQKKKFKGTRRETIHKNVPRMDTVVKRIKKLESHQELKWCDTSFAQVISASGTATCLNLLAEGDTVKQRVGQQISPTSLQWRGFIVTDSTDLGTSVVRLMFLWDRQANGSLPSILGDPTTGTSCILDNSVATATPNVYAPYAHPLNMRFSILYDKTFFVTPDTVSSFNPTTGVVETLTSKQKYLKGRIPLSRITKYDGATAGIGTVVTNSLLCVVIAGSVTTLPSIALTTRMYFKDP